MPYMLEPVDEIGPQRATNRAKQTYSLDRYLTSGPQDEPYNAMDVPRYLALEESGKKRARIQLWFSKDSRQDFVDTTLEHRSESGMEGARAFKPCHQYYRWSNSGGHSKTARCPSR
ncbi:hypothetical protein DOTSEDRAFT_73391, partial [Dothistroma septosporum NZE10]